MRFSAGVYPTRRLHERLQDPDHRYCRLEEIRQNHPIGAPRRGVHAARPQGCDRQTRQHHEFQIDDGETDSARHRRAGAAQTAIVGGKRWAIVTELRGAPEPNFEEIIATLEPCDLILVEGYKSAAIPKIEARRSAQLSKRALADEDPLVIAVAADHQVDGKGLPVFSLDDIREIANYIDEKIGPLKPRSSRGQKP